MKPEPLSKKIYNHATKIGIQVISLSFSGGNDEGYLNVGLLYLPNVTKPSLDADAKFSMEIEEWAWSVYDFSGAGDGSDYGDDIVYDLQKKTATSSEWSMQRYDSEEAVEDLEIAEKVKKSK